MFLSFDAQCFELFLYQKQESIGQDQVSFDAQGFELFLYKIK